MGNSDSSSLSDETAKPKEGDYTLCAYCGVISKFDSELNMMPLPSDGLIRLNEENPELYDELIRIQKTIYLVADAKAKRQSKLNDFLAKILPTPEAPEKNIEKNQDS